MITNSNSLVLSEKKQTETKINTRSQNTQKTLSIAQPLIQLTHTKSPSSDSLKENRSKFEPSQKKQRKEETPAFIPPSRESIIKSLFEEEISISQASKSLNISLDRTKYLLKLYKQFGEGSLSSEETPPTPFFSLMNHSADAYLSSNNLETKKPFSDEEIAAELFELFLNNEPSSFFFFDEYPNTDIDLEIKNPFSDEKVPTELFELFPNNKPSPFFFFDEYSNADIDLEPTL